MTVICGNKTYLLCWLIVILSNWSNHGKIYWRKTGPMNNMKLPDQCKFYWTGLADRHHREDWFWFLFEMKEYSCSCSATSWLYNKNKYFNSRGKHLWELAKTLYGKYVYDWKGNLVSMQDILDLQSYKFERSDVKINLVNICTLFWLFSVLIFLLYVYLCV